MTGSAEQFALSSARAHVKGADESGVLDMNWWQQQSQRADWRQYLAEESERTAVADAIRRATLTGRPFGSEEFISDLERRLNRNLSPLPAGRPRRIEQDENYQLGLWGENEK